MGIIDFGNWWLTCKHNSHQETELKRFLKLTSKRCPNSHLGRTNHLKHTVGSGLITWENHWPWDHILCLFSHFLKWKNRSCTARHPATPEIYHPFPGRYQSIASVHWLHLAVKPNRPNTRAPSRVNMRWTALANTHTILASRLIICHAVLSPWWEWKPPMFPTSTSQTQQNTLRMLQGEVPETFNIFFRCRGAHGAATIPVCGKRVK